MVRTKNIRKRKPSLSPEHRSDSEYEPEDEVPEEEEMEEREESPPPPPRHGRGKGPMTSAPDYPHPPSKKGKQKAVATSKEDKRLAVVLPGKAVLSSIAFEGTNIYSLLQTHKLLSFLSHHNTYSDDMVTQFYDTLDFDHDSQIISFKVNGEKRSLSLDDFAKIFKLRTEGWAHYQTQGFPSEDRDRVNECQEFMLAHARPPHSQRRHHQYNYELRILFKLFELGVLPTSRKDQIVGEYYLYVCYLFLIKEPINFALLILRHMLSAKSRSVGLPYGMALGYLFDHLKISRKRSRFNSLVPGWKFDLNALRRFGFIRFNGRWFSEEELNNFPFEAKSTIIKAISKGEILMASDVNFDDHNLNFNVDDILNVPITPSLDMPPPSTTPGHAQEHVGASSSAPIGNPSRTHQPSCGDAIMTMLHTLNAKVDDALKAIKEMASDIVELKRKRKSSPRRANSF